MKILLPSISTCQEGLEQKKPVSCPAMYSKRMGRNGFELKCRRSVEKKMHFSVRVVKKRAEHEP